MTDQCDEVACDLLSPFCGMLSLCVRRKCSDARVVIPSSRMYLLLSKQERLHFGISQLFIICLYDLIDFTECVFFFFFV